jgi:cobalamin synthase
MSHVVFFFSYIFVNAYTIFNDTSSQVAEDDVRKEHRKIRTFAIMVASAVILLLSICIRYMFMGEEVETLMGIFVALAAFAPLAYYAHDVAMLLGAQNGDMLGIMHQVMASIQSGNPTLCM